VVDSNGDLFGTTTKGGTGGGIVFELRNNHNGTYTEIVLHTFGGSDGLDPEAGLFMDGAGNLFGTTAGGGAHTAGTVFELLKSGGYSASVVYSFGNGSGDGANPGGTLIADGSGDLFGTSSAGGASGAGTIFELVKSGSTYSEQILASFTSSSDGRKPLASL